MPCFNIFVMFVKCLLSSFPQICKPFSGLKMAAPLLLIAIFAFTTTKVSCQTNFGNPPPLPAAGICLIFEHDLTFCGQISFF